MKKYEEQISDAALTENESLDALKGDLTELPNAASPEQIVGWKVKYGEVFQVSVEGRVAYLKKPDRKTLSYATSVAAKDPIKFNEIMLAGCWIAGDEEIKTDDGLFLAISGHLSELIVVKESAMLKL